MRGVKAKKIRRTVYGDYSFRTRVYRRTPTGAIVDFGRRGEYQRFKKWVKRGWPEITSEKRKSILARQTQPAHAA